MRLCFVLSVVSIVLWFNGHIFKETQCSLNVHEMSSFRPCDQPMCFVAYQFFRLIWYICNRVSSINCTIFIFFLNISSQPYRLYYHWLSGTRMLLSSSALFCNPFFRDFSDVFSISATALIICQYFQSELINFQVRNKKNSRPNGH